jgi:HEAT repeat protein
MKHLRVIDQIGSKTDHDAPTYRIDGQPVRPHYFRVKDVILFIALTALGATAQAQTYEGKPVGTWIQLLNDADLSTQRRAADALGAIGAAGAKQSVPALIAVLKRPVAPLKPGRTYRYATVELLGKPTNVDGEAAVQIAAAQALAEIGPPSSAAVSTLIGLLGRDRTTDGSTGLPKDLSKLDTSDAPALTNMLAVGMGDLALSEAASVALAAIGTPSVKPLIAALSHSTPNVRSSAARTLGRIGTPAMDAVSALEKVAESDTFDGARQNAKRALERIK